MRVDLRSVWVRWGTPYVLLVSSLVVAEQVTRDGRFYLAALLLTLPFGITAVVGVYVAFSFAAVACVAALGAYVALLFTPKASLNTLRFGFLALLVFFYAGGSWMPLSWQVAMAGAFTSDGFMRSALVGSVCLLVFAGGLLGAMRSRNN